ncbi:hypothetical protein SLEP1_g25865 [Rubroshorea leprosula]|uniref:Cystatin domain-containing protein n=1 Tax=Rubroshorea leprosula TaxID=152421 RepID=A0AAV5JKJ0_9ROSI|nr:hypothetical protein SLEP1_g25865 [Rubroshorea leprosula]
MLPNCRFLFLFISLLLLRLICAGASARLGVGGWQPIKDLNDSHVKGIAEFAVAEINKQSETNLKLDSIVKGEQQVVSGVNYRLILAIKDGVQSKSYEVTVWEKAWENFRKLISFKPAITI